MLFSYSYGWWQNQWWQTNVPPTLAILMAMRGRGCNAACIAKCSTSQGYTRSLGMLPSGKYLLWIAPVGIRATGKQTMKTSAPPLQAILMAMGMRRYVNVCISRWRRSRASLEATACCHWASIHSNIIKWTCLHWFCVCFHPQHLKTRHKAKGWLLITIVVYVCVCVSGLRLRMSYCNAWDTNL